MGGLGFSVFHPVPATLVLLVSIQAIEASQSLFLIACLSTNGVVSWQPENPPNDGLQTDRAKVLVSRKRLETVHFHNYVQHSVEFMRYYKIMVELKL